MQCARDLLRAAPEEPNPALLMMARVQLIQEQPEAIAQLLALATEIEAAAKQGGEEVRRVSKARRNLLEAEAVAGSEIPPGF